MLGVIDRFSHCVSHPPLSVKTEAYHSLFVLVLCVLTLSEGKYRVWLIFCMHLFVSVKLLHQLRVFLSYIIFPFQHGFLCLLVPTQYFWWCCHNTCGSNLDLTHSKYINYSKLSSMFTSIKTQWIWVLTFCSSNFLFSRIGFEPPLVSSLLSSGLRTRLWNGWVTKLGRDLIYLNREFVRDFLKPFFFFQ